MNNDLKPDENMFDENVLMNKQSLAYAKDLVKIYQEEKARRKALEMANQKIHAVLNSMTDGMIAINDAHEIFQVNQVICRLLETSREDLIGKNLMEVLDDPELKEGLAKIEAFAVPENRFELELDFPVKRVLRLSVSLISKGKGYVIIFHDVTSEKRTENLKNAFLSILSHELRTPLNGILISQQMLSSELSGKLEPRIEQFLGFLEKSGERMSNTIEELIKFAKLQHQELESLDQKVSLGHVIKDVFLSLDDERKNNDIQLHYSANVEKDRVTGNQYMLITLLHHIIQNAIVFGKKGGKVEVQLNAENSLFVLSIADNGIGIPATEIKKIFTSFYQVEEHKTRSRDGLGLGLSIAKHITELHKGAISIHSKLGKGTVCSIRLPKASKSRDTK